MNRLIRYFAVVFFAITFSYGGNYKLDKAHSSVGFEVTHMLVSTVTGNFSDFDTDFYFDKNNLEDSFIKATIRVASINTGIEKRDNHLRSDEFLNAKKYPEIFFKSDTIEKTKKGYVAKGILTIRDVSKAIELPFVVKGPVKDNRGNTRIGVSASTTINRQDFGVKWNKVLDGGGLVVSNEVKININAEFTSIDQL